MGASLCLLPRVRAEQVGPPEARGERLTHCLSEVTAHASSLVGRSGRQIHRKPKGGMTRFVAALASEIVNA